MRTSQAREKFRNSGIQTVSQERLIILLYERALRDLAEGRTATLRHDVEGAHSALVHAQQIVEELMLALRPDCWNGAESLRDLYQYVLSLLVQANTKRSVEPIDEAAVVLGQLSEAWQQAYVSLQPAVATS